MTSTRMPRAVLALVALTAALAFAACGSSSSAKAGANGTDRAFVSDMVPHHRSAVDMAKIAQTSSKRPQIKQLAGNIISAQSSEITTLSGIAKKLDDAGVKKGNLGMPMQDMGMSMSADMLKGAKPFDRAFVDMMIPHHQGAIRMARVELAKGGDAELKKIATAIVSAQSKEIDQMNAWRVSWYGKMSPAGGVPAEGSQGGDDMSNMG